MMSQDRFQQCLEVITWMMMEKPPASWIATDYEYALHEMPWLYDGEFPTLPELKECWEKMKKLSGEVLK